MKGPGSWTSSIVGFALAVLLVSWALAQLAEVIRENWFVLLISVVVICVVVVGISLWRRRDYW